MLLSLITFLILSYKESYYISDLPSYKLFRCNILLLAVF